MLTPILYFLTTIVFLLAFCIEFFPYRPKSRLALIFSIVLFVIAAIGFWVTAWLKYSGGGVVGVAALDAVIFGPAAAGFAIHCTLKYRELKTYK